MLIRDDGVWSLPRSKGLKSKPADLALMPEDHVLRHLERVVAWADAPEELQTFMTHAGFEWVVPMHSEHRLVGMIALGGCLVKADAEKCSLLATIADFAGIVLGNHLYRTHLEISNRQLQRRIFQLNTLYEIAGSFARCYEREQVYDVLAGNLMGHFFISRCVVIELGEHAGLAYVKGLRDDGSLPDLGTGISSLRRLAVRDQIDHEPLQSYMRPRRLKYAVTLEFDGQARAVVLLGSRLDGRPLQDEDMDFLNSLIHQAGTALENLALQVELLEKKRMEKELELAREIQQRLLPKVIPSIPDYDLSVEMRPYQHIGGDFYDLIPLSDGRLAICMADVSGKSLPASMIMSTTQASLRALTSFAGLSLVEIMQRLNAHIFESTQTNKYVTMFFAILDPRRNELSYINAGHNRPILIDAEGKSRELDCGGMVVGMFPSACYQTETVHFEKGADLLVFTDGLSEIVDESGEEFGELRLEQFLLQHRSMKSADELRCALVHRVLSFGAQKMIDDLTVMIVRRRAEDG